MYVDGSNLLIITIWLEVTSYDLVRLPRTPGFDSWPSCFPWVIHGHSEVPGSRPPIWFLAQPPSPGRLWHANRQGRPTFPINLSCSPRKPLSHMAEKSLGYPVVSRMGVVQKVQVSVFHCQGRQVSTWYFRESVFRVRESNVFLAKDLMTYFYMRLPRKIKRGVRERFAKVTYWFAKNGRL